MIVAAAGVIAGGVPAWELDEAQEEAILDVNLRGVMIAARVGIPALLKRPEPREGRFIAVASAAATRGLPNLAAYCAAKAGVVGFVRALAVELGRTGITANAVSPGSTRTPILDESARLYGLEWRGLRAPAAARPPARARGGRRADRLARERAEPRRHRRQPPGRRRPLPVRLVLDPGVRLFHGGRTLVARGRVIRLTEGGPAALRALLADTATPGAATPGRAPDRRRLRPTPARPRRRSTRRSSCPSRTTRRRSRAASPRSGARPIVVVDDGPRRVRRRRRGATLVRRARSGGPAAARNTGVAHVTTPFVAFLDSDASPRRLDRAARRALRRSAGGRGRPARQALDGRRSRSTWAPHRATSPTSRARR